MISEDGNNIGEQQKYVNLIGVFNRECFKGLGGILKVIDDSMGVIRFRKYDKGNLIDLNLILRNTKPF